MRGMICDDHPLMREALVSTLRHHWPHIEIVQAGDYPSAWALADANLDFCLVDLCMPGAEPLAGLRELLTRAPEAIVLVVTGAGDPALLEAVRRCGVAGVYPKHADPALLVEAFGAKLPQLSEGETARLPPRQREVLSLLAEGRTNKQIAQQLGVSPATVKVHVKRLMSWLEASNRTEAVSIAQKARLL